MGKILLVANTDWYLYNFRSSLARFLRNRGHQVVYVSPPGKYVQKLLDDDFSWLCWDVGRQSVTPWQELKALRQLHQIYRKENPDLVHHFTIKPVLYGSLSARLNRVPGIVNSVTGLGYIFLQNSLKARLLRGLARVFYKYIFGSQNSLAIFENQHDRAYFTDTGLVSPRQSVVIAGVGVDTTFFSPAPEPPGTPIIVLPARLLWDKGVGVLAEAARLLCRRQRVRIALVGEPDPGNPATVGESAVQAWVQEGILEWWGWQEDMRAVYQNCHVVTLPSMGEGLPTALIEAEACARPVVATDVPGCRDVVVDGTNGFLVPPGDPAALADALEKLVVDPGLRCRMGAAGRQQVVEQFTSDLVNTATLDVYRRALDRASSSQI